MKLRDDLTGLRYGRWTVIERDHSMSGPRHRVYWKSQCDCGVVRSVLGDRLKNGTSQSCGCLHHEELAKRLTRHGLANTPTWYSWNAMMKRCYEVNHSSFRNYGGRGIKVCESWHTFENFLADMGQRPHGLTLDRLDINRGYEPDNCRWATWAQQASNRRPKSR